jgi:hypothetical protein
VSPSRATTASRGSSRVGIAASAMPAWGYVGRSLSECTATSTSPRSNASRSAPTNTPVPPTVASGVPSAWLRSPSVVTSTSSASRPSWVRIISATIPDWVVASTERRVPTRMGRVIGGPALPDG